MSPANVNLSNFINTKIEELKLGSTHKTAAVIGITQSTLTRILNGNTKEVSVETLGLMAHAFKCSIYELIEANLKDLSEWHKDTDKQKAEKFSQLIEHQKAEQEEFCKRYFRATQDMDTYLTYETDYLITSCDAVVRQIDNLKENILKHLDITVRNFPDPYESRKEIMAKYAFISKRAQSELLKLETKRRHELFLQKAKGNEWVIPIAKTDWAYIIDTEDKEVEVKVSSNT